MSKKYIPKKPSSFNPSKDGRGIRLCHAQTCPNFLGMSNRDPDLPLFGAPNREFRRIWELAINGTASGANIKLCHLHFREEDFVMNNEGLSLKKDAIPIPIAVPKTEITEDPLVDPLTIMDVETIKSASDQQTVCKSCIDYDVQLQSARSEIAELKRKLSELTAKNTNLMKQLECISNEEQHSKPCRLCKVKLTSLQLKQHLCIDQESIVCPICPHSLSFESTVSFLQHLDQHIDTIRSIDKRLWYKCNQCNLGYPIKKLLECHKKSHGDVVEVPIKVESNETDVLITIDETTSNDNSNSPDDLITVKIEIDESSGNEVPEAPEEINVAIQSSNLAEENLKPAEQTIKLFKCGICNMLFDLGENLSCHIRENHPKKRAQLECSVCKKNFTTRKDLRIHFQSHAEDVVKDQQYEVFQTPLTLDELNSRLGGDEITSNDYSTLSDDLITVKIEIDDSSRNELLEASKEFNISIQPPNLAEENLQPANQTIKLFKCEICNMVFDLLKELKRHMRKNHPKKRVRYPVLECYVCRENFPTRRILRAHVKSHYKNEAKDQKCEVCQAALTLDELNSHVCGGETTIRCDYCSDEFTSTSKLLEHIEKSHETRKLHACDKCSKFFSIIQLKEFHMKTHDEPDPFMCKICSKTFALKQSLNLHIKTHENTKSHLCEECGKTFVSERNLEFHKNSFIHHSEPTLQCPDCPRKFFRSSNLLRHREIHRDNNYICEICNAVLKSKGSFKKHMKRHKRKETDRRFECALCPLKFFTAPHLKKHQTVHTNLKLFSCRFCDVSYKYNADLHKHLRTHLGDKMYECRKCPQKFQYHMELQKHEFEHYKEEKEAKGTNE